MAIKFGKETKRSETNAEGKKLTSQKGRKTTAQKAKAVAKGKTTIKSK
jgi:hypothetical protein